MQVVLLERVERLGQMGDVVSVKDGYARNYLLTQGKARRATKENLEIFDTQRAQIEAQSLDQRKEADAVAEKLEGTAYVVLRQAGEAGQLYGSVSTRDIAEAVTAAGFTVTRSQVSLAEPIKNIGLHDALVKLHSEVSVTVSMNVARSEDEAERQARGENVIGDRTDEEEAALALAEEVFESEELAHEAEEALSDEPEAEASEEEAAPEADAAEDETSEEEKTDSES